MRTQAIALTGTLPPVLRERFGLEWTRAKEAELRAAGAASRALGPALPQAAPHLRPDLSRVARRGDRAQRHGSRARRGAPAERSLSMAAEVSNVIALALDPSVEPPDDALSERILDAALALAAGFGLRNLTVDDVARRAKVGRMTVYRRFGTKQRLVDALTVRESRRCLAELDAAAPVDAPADEQVAAGFVTALRIAREHPLLNRLARVEPETVLEAFTADGSRLFATMRAFAAARMRAAQEAGVLGAVAVDETAELGVRLCISFVLIQESVLPIEDEEAARDIARRLLMPLLA